MDRRREKSEDSGRSFCQLLADEANLTASALQESWRGAGSDTQIAELRALRYGAYLVHDCKRATSRVGEGDGVLAFVMYHPDPETRYEARAALSILAGYDLRMAPYHDALGRLAIPSEVTLDAMCEQLRVQEPVLVTMWHNWLWPQGLAVGDHGDASLLAVAATHLSRSMEAIVGITST